MPRPSITSLPAVELFEPLDQFREFHLSLSVREYNGIESDPKVTPREPTVSEAILALEAFAERLRSIQSTFRSTL